MHSRRLRPLGDSYSIRAALGVAAAMLAVLPAAAQGGIHDTIVTNDGARLRGVTVTEATTQEIKYTKGDSEEKIATDKVAAIEWHEPPEPFLLAEGEEAKGDWENAANHYMEAAKTPDLRPPLALEAQFRAARAMLSAAAGDAAKAAAAATALQGYLDAAPEGYRAPAARLLVARALRLQGKAQEAETALETLRQDALTNGWGLGWEARARVEAALALLAQGKFGDARNAYAAAVSGLETALGPNGTDPELRELRNEAVIGQGECWVAEKQYDQALTYFRRFTAAPATGESTALQAAALAGEGEALYLKAEASGDPALLREALTALARANVIDPVSGAATAKALFFSGKVLLALGPDREKDARSRALSYFDSVIRYHADSRWAAPARAEVTR